MKRTNRPLTSATLADRLERRLDELNAERTAIEQALASLRRHTARREGSPPKVARSATGLREELLMAIRESPGTRASMLALIVGKPVEAVRSELETLQVSGAVERWRLGFRVPDQVGLSP